MKRRQRVEFKTEKGKKISFLAKRKKKPGKKRISFYIKPKGSKRRKKITFLARR